MPNPFEQQKEAELRSLRNKLSMKVHPDRFNGYLKGEFADVLKENESLGKKLEECREKAGEFSKKINEIKDSKVSVDIKLADMRNLGKEIDSFLGTNGFADLMKELNDLKDKKKKAQEKNGENKKTCPKCGKENRASFSFCVFCMAKLDEDGQNGNGNGNGDEDVEKERQAAYEKMKKEADHEEANEMNKKFDEEKAKEKVEKDHEEANKMNEQFDKDKTGQENNNIEQLKKELEEARQKYAQADYKVNNNISKIKAIFGKFLKTEPADVSEVNEAYNAYKSKASELSRAQLDALKNNKNLDPETMKKELGNLVKYFNYDEKMNLRESRTNARAEANKNNIAFQALKGSGWLINKYRKLNWKTKLIGGAVFGVITGGSLVMAQRGFGSVVAGVGAMAAMEALQRKGEEKKSAKEAQNMLNGFENSEEQMKMIMSYLDGEINGYEASLKDELKKARMRKFVGLAAGAGTFVIGNYAGSFMRERLISGLGYISEVSEGASEVGKVEDIASGGADPLMPETAKISGENFSMGETPKGGNMFSPEDAAAKSPVSNAAERILEVKKGSNLEGTLIKHLEANGMSHEEAGKAAHKMALEYAENNHLKDGPYSLIHEGAKLQLTPDGKGIMGIYGDDKIGYLSKNEIPSGSKSQIFEETKIGKNADPLTAKNDVNFQRNETMAKILENEGKIKTLDQQQEDLLREINNSRGIENTRPGAHEELLKVQESMEQLRKTNQGLSSDLESLNKKGPSNAFSANSENGITQEASTGSKAEPLGNRTAVGQEEWKANGSGTKYMRSFEHNFGNVEDNKQLYNALSEKKFIGSDPSATARNIKTSFFDAYGKKNVFVSLQDKSMYAIMKDPGTRLQIFKGFGSGDQITFEKMLKAVPPEKHPTESLHRWISRVSFAMENIRGEIKN